MTVRKNRSAKARSTKPADQIIDADVSEPPVAARAAMPPPPPPLPVIEDDPCAPPEPYDPADYRWVPVRRRPRYDGWTEEKQRKFVEVLADTGQIRLAAKAVGLSREAAYKLRRSGLCPGVGCGAPAGGRGDRGYRIRACARGDRASGVRRLRPGGCHPPRVQ